MRVQSRTAPPRKSGANPYGLVTGLAAGRLYGHCDEYREAFLAEKVYHIQKQKNLVTSQVAWKEGSRG